MFVANMGVFDANRLAEIKQFVSVPSTRWRLNVNKKTYKKTTQIFIMYVNEPVRYNCLPYLR